MTVQEYLKEKTELFSRSGVPEAENEAWVVLETVSGLTRSSIRFSFAKELAEVVSGEVFSSLEKTYELRACGEPLAYIVGHAPFYDLEFSVGEGVLIPRFDTEVLVETALKALGVGDFPFPDTDGPVPQVNTAAPFIIYDLCTGSGCVGITIGGGGFLREKKCAEDPRDAGFLGGADRRSLAGGPCRKDRRPRRPDRGQSAVYHKR